ncbi:MAG: PLP-dependent aminotransferase family protein [Sulfolobus sp.]
MLKFSDYANELEESQLTRFLNIISSRKNIISFANGLPDPYTFPIYEIKDIINEILNKNPSIALQYTLTCGPLEVKSSVLQLAKKRGINNITEDNICIISGSQEGIFIIFHLFLNKGDYLVLEKPTYLAALETSKPLNVKYIDININKNGYEIDNLEDKINQVKKEGNSSIKLMYLIPTAQNPSGLTMSENIKKKIIDIAISNDIYILEDDAYGFLTFDEYSLPLRHYNNSHVIYIGSLSKILSSGLRLGYIIAEEKIIKKVESLKQNINAHTPTLNQLILAEAVSRGIIFSNLPKIIQRYKIKRNVMLNAISKYFPKEVMHTYPLGGMFIFNWLPEGINAFSILEKSLEKNVVFMPGEFFYYDKSGKNTFRLTYSLPNTEDIYEGIKNLGEVLSQFLK